MLQLIIEALSLVIFTVLGLLSRLLYPFKRLLVCYRTLASFLPRRRADYEFAGADAVVAVKSLINRCDHANLNF
jgi:hypothetical protein